MTTLVRRGIASSVLGACSLALALSGCGGGGSGTPSPTATPIGTPNGTPDPTVTPTSTTPPGTGGSPVNSNEVAFISDRSGTGQLYKSSKNGSSVVKITARPQAVDNPSVSRDGSRLLFQFVDPATSAGNSNLEIALVNADGSGYTRLTSDTTAAGRPDDYAPFFSPDGRFIYWTSTRQGINESGQLVDGVPHIWRMNGQEGSTGIDQKQVTLESSAYPSVAANGNLAYFALNKKSSTPVAISSIGNGVGSTSQVIRYVGAPVGSDQSVFGVALSPNGSRVAYTVGSSSNQSTSSAISIYPTDGTAALTSPSAGTGASNHSGAWSRDSQTLFFDALTATGSARQVFSSTAPFSSSTQVTTSGAGNNYSPALLPGTS